MAVPDADTCEVEISGLGARGDGIAETPSGRLYVPLAAPGDRLLVRLESVLGDGQRAQIVRRLADGAGRGSPPCPHFGQCGGCAVQHLAPQTYADWKHGLLQGALARRGLDPALAAPLQSVPAASRRRVRFQARRLRHGVALGYFAAASHRVVNIDQCPVALPAIVGLLAPLRRLLAELLPPGGRAGTAVTLADGGLDVLLELAAPPDRAGLERLAAFAESADLARLCWRPRGGGVDSVEPVAMRRPVRADFSGVAVDLPPDGFMQATEAGERLLCTSVVDGLADAGAVADLYAGCGAFSFALAGAGKRVRAVEAAAGHVAALDAAAHRAGVDQKVAVERRDLVRRPLGREELTWCDGVVLDPPRPGAAAQIRSLATSPVPAIAYVSCNPASFARDAATLVAGGYRLKHVTPIDQFTWSPHLELVGIFEKN
jgi:23S rRNA (uracil1939-C5)-methyltransferase